MTATDPFSEEASSSPFEDNNDQPGPRPESDAARVEMSSLAWTVGRTWVEDHQEAAMLGAFAVGVFVGALFRD